MKETKYLEMIMDEHLTCKNHIDTVKLKLNRANGLLAKLRHYVSPKLLNNILMPFLKPTCDMDCYCYFFTCLCLFINDTDLNQCFELFSSIYVQQS